MIISLIYQMKKHYHMSKIRVVLLTQNSKPVIIGLKKVDLAISFILRCL